MTPNTVTVYNGLITIWVIWLDETKMVRLKIVRKSVRRILIGRKRKLVRMTMRPTCRPARLIWLDETESGLIFWDATDWLVRWTCLLETLLIGWSDGSVFRKRFWLADPMDLSSAPSFDFFVLLVARFHTAIHDWQETITRKRLLLATNMLFWYVVDAWNRQNERHLCLLTLPVVD